MVDASRQVLGGNDRPGRQPAPSPAIERVVARREAIFGILKRAYDRDLGRRGGKRTRIEG
jgi:hypothetical protein